ncbi:hypothetical protein EDD36DRAFT_467175 [Exophiala viscosa]|uniref:Uncharacterized protein n=1 Tax=Exophiala viscosa TaxID=2486360 RepID=A0AAN6IBE3_9EURO|nr:hypothetical protein EDD36DRAFT_467175 [Exophiala viscosa]
MSKDAIMSNNSDEIFEIAKELFILPGEHGPQQETEQEFWIPPAEDQALPEFKFEDYVNFPPTLMRNPPRNANTIFCHCSFGASLVSNGSGVFVTYRMRNGDLKYITNFLSQSVGPDPSFCRDQRFWKAPAQTQYEPHLVEVVSYSISGAIMRDTKVSYCALPNTGEDGLEGNKEEGRTGYDIVPVCLFGNIRFLRGTGQHMLLETRWLISCKLCDKWYEVNVYR